MLGIRCYRCLYVHRLVFLSFRAPPYAILAYGGLNSLRKRLLWSGFNCSEHRFQQCPGSALAVAEEQGHELARDSTMTTDLVPFVHPCSIPPFVVSPCGGSCNRFIHLSAVRVEHPARSATSRTVNGLPVCAARIASIVSPKLSACLPYTACRGSRVAGVSCVCTSCCSCSWVGS